MSKVHRRPRIALVAIAAVAALVLVIAGCGGSGSGADGTQSAPAPAVGGSKIALARTDLGRVLVDGSGRTLYLFEADKGTQSACDGSCASVWPPLTTDGKPVAGAGLSGAKLGTTKRSDGTTEVTYNGHPLYTYVGDGTPGQTTGQGLDDYGAEWYVLSASGDKVDAG
jgi:predicted lipoprotein with Yx(FWY)xxD motif